MESSATNEDCCPSTSASSASDNAKTNIDPIIQLPPQPLLSTTALSNKETPLNTSTIFPDPSTSKQCRICLLTTHSKRKPLISPCHCSGTVQYVHIHCLTHWIEVSSRKATFINSNRYPKPPSPRCELCGFRYRKAPFVNLTQIHLPFMDIRDRILNCLCILLIFIMGICVWVAGQHVQNANNKKFVAISNRNRVATISQPDITILVSVLLLFTAFFLAIFTQYRAEVTLFRTISRLWETNRNWRICDLPLSNNKGGEKEIFIKRKNEIFMENAQTQTFLTSNMLVMKPEKI
ncbi:RING-CH-type domain-containing protein [Meloidogyne graminicola]|uniref:RING-CH-type domain-containing protein n=1 Tax=Meloidogyne graminicola TaxID=189291 RepID=A0A8T0A1K8_9BILA|nr:RING-CH-type domain-containing protein [Meloidogyne graminicola]